MDKLTPVSFNQAVGIINENRKAFKAGMIAIMCAAQLELTGESYTKDVWTSKDEAMLGKLYNEYLDQARSDILK